MQWQHDEQETLRPKGSRAESEIHDHQTGAAGSGLPDLLDTESVIGLQRSAGNAAVNSLLDDERSSPVHDVINTPGRPLDPETRTDMEGRLGADFGDVRLHDDSAAHDSAASVNAHAYTVGRDIVFQRDQLDPSSDSGRTTLAHELTHVIQQRNGPVDGTEAPGGIKISDPSDRFEQEASANAERVVTGPAVQRAEDLAEDEEGNDSAVQTQAIQRQEAVEEPEDEESL